MTTPAPARPDVAHRVFSTDGCRSASRFRCFAPAISSPTSTSSSNSRRWPTRSAFAHWDSRRAAEQRRLPRSGRPPRPVGPARRPGWHARAGSRSPAARSCCRCVIRCISRKARCRSRHCRAAASFSSFGSGDRPPEYAAFGVDADAARPLPRPLGRRRGRARRAIARGARRSAARCARIHAAAARRRRRADAGGRLGRTKCRLDRAALARLDDVPPRSGHAAHAIRCGARRSTARDARLRAFGVSMRLDLVADPDAPATALPLGYATGRRALIDILRDMHAAGTHHVTLNPETGPARARSHRGNRGTRSAGFHDRPRDSAGFQIIRPDACVAHRCRRADITNVLRVDH